MDDYVPRAIKFRFYDLDRKKMLYHIDGITQNPLGKSLSNNLRPLITINGDICRPNYGFNCITMQFTGKCDRNGKDVYEGDIIEFDADEWGADNNIHIVTWNDEDAEWCFGGGTASDMEWRTVIGNIYENQELIQKMVK